MHISAPTLDDLLQEVFQKLLKSRNVVEHSSRGKNVEELGALLELSNPRARLSGTEKKGTIFSCLGEFLWYLARTNDLEFIRYYIRDYGENSDDGKTIYGAYGPRIFSKNGKINQFDNVVSILRRKPDSRQAVIQLFDAADIIEVHKDIPCTCTLQFMIRRGRLHMFTSMRSNDAFLGLPHDVFSFTMFQELAARTLSVELGTYKHAAGSLHLYDRNKNSALEYLGEGWQSTTSSVMPAMPVGDPWASVSWLLDAESAIREGKGASVSYSNIAPYWADLARLLQIYRHVRDGKLKDIAKTKDEMSSDIYEKYVRKKQTRLSVDDAQPELPLPNG